MIALHSVYVVTFVSQATSAGILAVLAWHDRRSRGMVALAAACALHVLAIALIPLWRGQGRWQTEALSAALLPFMFWLIHQGLRPFVRSRATRWSDGLPVMLGVMAVVVAVAPWSQLWSMQLARAAAIVQMALSARMLWSPQLPSIRLPARLTAALLVLTLGSFLVRLPFEPHHPNSPVVVAVREVTTILITLLAFSFLAMYLAESKRRLHQETRMDALTGLLNRRALEERAALEVRRAARQGSALTLLMMDLDAFKLLNDTWGHNVGDRALEAVGASLLATSSAAASTVARLGGEEFAILLPGQELSVAYALAEQVRAAVAGIVILEGTRRVSLTISVGVAKWHSGELTWTEMLQRADAALYRAKRDGRNRVVCSDPVLRCPEPARAGSSSPPRKVERSAPGAEAEAAMLPSETSAFRKP